MRHSPHWDPYDATMLADPAGQHDSMRQQCPVAHSDALHWSVFRHDDVTRILNDPQTFSNQVSRHLAVPNSMDPPEHTRYRNILDPYFSPQRMAQFAPQCHDISHALVKALPVDTDFDVMAMLAYPFALRVQCAFLGWSTDLHAALHDWIAQRNAAAISGDAQAQRAVAESFDTTIRAVLAQRRADPGSASNDVTASLMRETIDGQPLSDDVLVSILRNWTVGELGTIAASIGILLQYLAMHPELQQTLRTQPELIGAANDEILRIHAPLPMNRRITTRPCTLSGTTLPAGTRLTLMWGAANRDDDAFDAPLECRPDRDPAPNLLYGAGIHACPGAPLARMALQSIIHAVLAHTPDITAAAMNTAAARWPASGFQQLGLRFGITADATAL